MPKKSTSSVNNETTEKVKEQKKNDETTELKKQIEQMQALINSLMQNQNKEKVVVQEENEVVIGCRVIQGVGWGDPRDPSGEIRLRFGEEQSVTVSDMKRFFRQHTIRKLFEDGLCYFANEEDYAIFNIRKHIDLSDENLIKILTQSDTNLIISDLDDMTSYKKDSSIINCLIFRICDLIKNRKITWDYYTRKAIEEYFKTDFDRGIHTLSLLERAR